MILKIFPQFNYVFFDLRLNKRLGTQSRRRWCETPSRSLLRHCYIVRYLVLMPLYALGPVSLTIFARNLNSMKVTRWCNSTTGHQIATNFCTYHDSTAVVLCTKYWSDHCVRIRKTVMRNFHRIWNAMDKPLLKRAPCPLKSTRYLNYWYTPISKLTRERLNGIWDRRHTWCWLQIYIWCPVLAIRPKSPVHYIISSK